jgi:hypothetical protein
MATMGTEQDQNQTQNPPSAPRRKKQAERFIFTERRLASLVRPAKGSR